jgi:dTDP-4-dehydrorhamnose reductase
MKVLIIGGSGMLGHQLCRHFAPRHDVCVTLRGRPETRAGGECFQGAQIMHGVEATDPAALERVLETVQPEAVLNCVGIIKQLAGAHDAILSIRINSLLPHLLQQWAAAHAARLVHFSTDCVFSGRKGAYTEQDSADAQDLYGRSKLLGELTTGPGITLRSSIIGREINSSHALLEWFLSQRGKKIRGYRRAIFSGFTTHEMARIAELVLTRQRELHGVWQVAANPISKYDLLSLVRDRFGLPVEIEPFDDFHCDRSLDASRFNAATGYVPPSWPTMIDELAADSRT